MSSLRLAAQVLGFISLLTMAASAEQRTDYLTFAAGAVPVRVSGDAEALKVGLEKALATIDGNPKGFGVSLKPGASTTEVVFIYRLPAATTFTEFAVPNVLETPSPSQTFFRDVELAGAVDGPDGPFEVLARATLTTHTEKGALTNIAVAAPKPASWLKLTLRGGIDVQRDKTFFEFSEIVGYGSQETVDRLDAFTGKWKGRGVLVDLAQDGATVTGCYDRDGDLVGTVTGNILRATGTTRSAGIQSVFVLTVSDGGKLTGVASTNGAPFRIYEGESAPNANTKCRVPNEPPLGCGSIVHGINFDYDSATIRSESEAVLDELHRGLSGATEAEIAIIGHTSSEGSDEYNANLSERRATAVVEALAARGINRGKLSAHGLGEQRPIADNSTEAGRSLNRRVEIECK